MQTDVSDLRSTIVAKSDQLNADQLVGGPITIRVSAVKLGGTEQQPITVHYENDAGRPFKPCLTMRRVLIFSWGKDGREWVGRSMTLYTDPTVKFGGDEVGGIRISHLSHIDRDVRVSLAVTKGRKAMYVVKPLRVESAATDQDKHAAMLAEFEQIAREYGLQAFIDAWNATPKPSRPPTTERDRIAAIATQRDQQQQEKA